MENQPFSVMPGLVPGIYRGVLSSRLFDFKGLVERFEMVSCDGVCDDDDFSHDGDESDFSWPFVVCREPDEDVLHGGWISDGGAGGIEEDLSDIGPSVAVVALYVFWPLSRV